MNKKDFDFDGLIKAIQEIAEEEIAKSRCQARVAIEKANCAAARSIQKVACQARKAIEEIKSSS